MYCGLLYCRPIVLYSCCVRHCIVGYGMLYIYIYMPVDGAVLCCGTIVFYGMLPVLLYCVVELLHCFACCL